MHILLIVIGLLLMFLGGGCTLTVVGLIGADPSSLRNDFISVVLLLLPAGVAPLVIGIQLFRWGLRIDREKCKAAVKPPNDGVN